MSSRKSSVLDSILGIILICFILPELFKSNSNKSSSSKSTPTNWASVIAYSIIFGLVGVVSYHYFK